MSGGAGFRRGEPVDSARSAADPVPQPSSDEIVPVRDGSEAGQMDREEWPVSAEAIPVATGEEPEAEAGMDTGFVRPYAITGGRTRANHMLEMETLISTRSDDAIDEPEQVEQRSIMSECRNPRSVAEIASVLGVPVGVARVLISD